MSLSSPWQAPAPPPENLTAFERAARQIAEEERRLRLIAEGQLREYLRLIVEFAGLFLAEELDQRIRADPHFVGRATPETWRSLLQGVRQGALSGLPSGIQPGNNGSGQGWATEAKPEPESDRWRSEAERLRAEMGRLEDENRFLRSLIQPALAPQPDGAGNGPAQSSGPLWSQTGSLRLTPETARTRAAGAGRTWT